MASRKSSSPKGARGRKVAAGKTRKASPPKTAARKPTAKRAGGAAGKPVAAKPAAARPAAARAAAANPAAARAVGSPLAELARRIIRATTAHAGLELRDFYAPTCTSREAAGDTVTGYAGLQAKLERWNQMQDPAKTRWKARSVATGDGTIWIEWEGKVHLRDGRVVDFSEAAVHEVKDGKIVAERYYYNPQAFAPPQS